MSVKLLSLCCFLPDFCYPSKVLTQCKSLHLLRNNSRKSIDNTSFFLLPHHCWVYFFRKGKSEQICAGRDAYSDKYIASASACSWRRFSFA